MSTAGGLCVCRWQLNARAVAWGDLFVNPFPAPYSVWLFTHHIWCAFELTE